MHYYNCVLTFVLISVISEFDIFLLYSLVSREKYFLIQFIQHGYHATVCMPGCKSKLWCKDQESVESSTTPDPRYQWESDILTVRHHKNLITVYSYVSSLIALRWVRPQT